MGQYGQILPISKQLHAAAKQVTQTEKPTHLQTPTHQVTLREQL